MKENMSSYILKEPLELAQKNAGGRWQAALAVPALSNTEYTSDEPQQAASLIKLFIMGAVFEKYETCCFDSATIAASLHKMITVSDNNAANYLVKRLGEGNSNNGKTAVNEYCAKHGYNNTSMGRLLLENVSNGNNLTTAYDCAKFLLAAYNGLLPGSDKMITLLGQQRLVSKIPAGVPVPTANKTGELDSVQNDAAIIYAEKPYILCVLAENVSEQNGVAEIVKLSSEIYKRILL